MWRFKEYVDGQYNGSFILTPSFTKSYGRTIPVKATGKYRTRDGKMFFEFVFNQKDTRFFY